MSSFRHSVLLFSCPSVLPSCRPSCLLHILFISTQGSSVLPSSRVSALLPSCPHTFPSFQPSVLPSIRSPRPVPPRPVPPRPLYRIAITPALFGRVCRELRNRHIDWWSKHRASSSLRMLNPYSVFLSCPGCISRIRYSRQWRRYTRSCQVKWPGEKANDLAVDLAVKHLGKIIIKDYQFQSM